MNTVAAVEVDGTGRMYGKRIDSNAIVSVHSRDNAISKLLSDAVQSEASGAGGIILLAKRKSPRNGEGSRGTIPRRLYHCKWLHS